MYLLLVEFEDVSIRCPTSMLFFHKIIFFIIVENSSKTSLFALMKVHSLKYFSTEVSGFKSFPTFVRKGYDCNTVI